MKTCIDRYSDVRVNWVFEVACGFAPHAGELTRQGYHYLGLDNNRNMLDYGHRKWRQLRPRPELLNADMISFVCPREVDFAYVMLGSLYLNTPGEMHSHFDSVAKALRPGGLYFLDCCVQFDDPMNYAENNTVRCEQDGVTVESEFNIRRLDPTKHMYEEVWTLNVNDQGRHRRLQMTERNRAVSPAEFLTFVRNRSDFDFVGWWRAWDLAEPITDTSQVTRPVALLKRT